MSAETISDSTPVIKPPADKANSATKVAVASFVGTAVEFYDFYIYGLASALFLGPLFFPSGENGLETMAAFLTFGIAFIARPIGSILFGHYGDKIGRKNALVGSMLIMGISTILIGFLPTYAIAGFWAPLLLCLFRFGQGIGLGGEWGGAAILATESAPRNKRALFAMFPQIGPPIGFILASGVFIILNSSLSTEDMFSYGWRIPFLLSVVLVVLGLYVRISLIESPIFHRLLASKRELKVPVLATFKQHYKTVFLGSLAAMSCFILFFITTVFSLQYETAPHEWLGGAAYFSKSMYLFMMMIAIIFMALGSVLSAYLCEEYGRKTTLILSGILTIGVALFLGWGFNSGNAVVAFSFISASLFVMGMLFMPLAAFLPEIFPASVRYTGASLAFSFGGILGGSLTPFFASWIIAQSGKIGIYYVSLYIIVGSLISIWAVWMLHETKKVDYNR